jgi:hypothetical protein
MYEQKEELLQRYYQLTLKLVNELNIHDAEMTQALLDERQACIEKVTHLDQCAGQVLLNAEIKEQLLQIAPLDANLQTMLKGEQQKILANIHALKKEKKIKQYGETAYGSNGLFYDKRK